MALVGLRSQARSRGRLLAAQRVAIPVGYGGADLVRRVLLDEVVAGDSDFGLVGPGAAELPLAAGEDGAGLSVDEQLRDGTAGGKPFGVTGDDCGYLGRLVIDGDLAGPGQGRPAGLPADEGRPPRDIHLLPRPAAKHRARPH